MVSVSFQGLISSWSETLTHLSQCTLDQTGSISSCGSCCLGINVQVSHIPAHPRSGQAKNVLDLWHTWGIFWRYCGRNLAELPHRLLLLSIPCIDVAAALSFTIRAANLFASLYLAANYTNKVWRVPWHSRETRRIWTLAECVVAEHFSKMLSTKMVLICGIFVLLRVFLFPVLRLFSCIAAKITATMDCGTFSSSKWI